MKDQAKSEGYVKLYRSSLHHPIFKDREAWHLFIYCLLKANHKAGTVTFKRNPIHIDRGQFIFGLERASQDLGMSIAKIRSALEWLTSLKVIARKTTNRFSIISICNYDLYQNPNKREKQADEQTEPQKSDRHARTLREQSENSKQECKEVNNIGRSKKETDPRDKEFFDYWRETFQKETGQPYVFNFGKEGKLVKAILQVHPLETLQESTGAFFQDEQCKRRGLTIGIFYQEINRLVGLKRKSSW